jgi:putative flavoprotein involved in K+ transport
MLEKTPTTKVQSFLDKFGKALEQGHIGDAVNMFQADCFWRDLVAFTWNLKTVEGRKTRIADMLQATRLAAARGGDHRRRAGRHRAGGAAAAPGRVAPS